MNKVLKDLALVENGLKNEGASFVIKNAGHLQSLNLSKNGLNHNISEIISKFLENS